MTLIPMGQNGVEDRPKRKRILIPFPIGKIFVTFVQFDISFHTICPFQLGPNSGLHIIIFDEIDAICKVRGSVVSIVNIIIIIEGFPREGSQSPKPNGKKVVYRKVTSGCSRISQTGALIPDFWAKYYYLARFWSKTA